jgi:hypothetical protein
MTPKKNLSDKIYNDQRIKSTPAEISQDLMYPQSPNTREEKPNPEREREREREREINTQY